MVDKRDQCCVAPAIQDLLQTGLQGTELPALRLAIDGDERAMRVHHRFENGFVLARYHDDKVGVRLKQVNGSTQKRVRDRRSLRHWRPGQQRLVPAHAGGKSGGQNHSANAGGKDHGSKIAETVISN